jgi:uncharacterized protein (DUF1015 family)
VADLRPFRAVRYDPNVVDDLGRVVSPPYDVIPEAALEGYRGRSPYNVVRLIRPGTVYAGAAAVADRWLAEGVLVEDRIPAMYLHEVQFEGGRRRRDLIGALRLQPYEDKVVLPHERTHAGPKEDRLALMRATGLALEPLWFLYRGRGTALPGLLEAGFGAEPTLEFETDGKEGHRFWVVGDPGWQSEVRAALAGLTLLIADGHHRYETTLLHAQELGGPEDAASRFTPALLSDLDDRGLVVLPTHRALRAGVALTGGEPAGSLAEVLEAIHGRMAAGYYRAGRFQVLPLEGEVAVVELHRQVIENILGARSLEENVAYTRDPEEAVRLVDSGEATAAFFLGPPDLGAVLKLAEAGITMPQKTTFFYPKPPSGLVFHRLDQERSI